MSSLPSIEPGASDFLADVRGAAWWCKSPFGASQMTACFSPNSTLTVDFSIEISEGNWLTSDAHAGLLSDIYDFLLIQTHPTARGKRSRSPDIERLHVIRCLYIIDHMLLNAAEYRLAEFGLRAITRVHLRQLLVDRASSNDVAIALYGWQWRLEAYLKSKILLVDEYTYARVVSETPEIADTELLEQDYTLTLSRADLVVARIWLWLNGYYIRASHLPYRYTPSSRALGNELYQNTLWGKNPEFNKPVFEELCWSPRERTQKEYEGVPVKSSNSDAACAEITYRRFKNTFSTFRLLSELGIGIPLDALEDVKDFTLGEAVRLKPAGRMQTVPPEQVLSAARHAVNFFYDHSTHLLSSFCRVLIAAKREGLSMRNFLSVDCLDNHLSQKTRQFGVKVWSLSSQMYFVETNPTNKTTRPEISEYFRRLRGGEGLLQNIRALFGAMQIIIGLPMAARQGELIDLPLNCLDETHTWLSLLTRKSGYGTLRAVDHRPIPVVGADIVQRLRATHRLLRRHGVTTADHLFQLPNELGNFSNDHKSYNTAIDIFIDYIDAPRTTDGRRYYLRQHQLRRSFVLLFYAYAAFATLDALGWFLRQMDSEQLHNYLTESMPGAILRTTKSIAAVMLVRAGRHESRDLAHFVEKRFGATTTSTLSLDGFNEYVTYLEKLQIEGAVEIKPIYFDTPDGKRHRLAILVWGDENEI